MASNNTDGGVEGSPDGVTIVTTAAPEGVVGTVPFTGAWQTYTDVYLDVPLDAGFQTIRFNATHEGWNINYFDIQMEAKAVVTPEGVTKIEAEDFGPGRAATRPWATKARNRDRTLRRRQYGEHRQYRRGRLLLL